MIEKQNYIQPASIVPMKVVNQDQKNQQIKNKVIQSQNNPYNATPKQISENVSSFDVNEINQGKSSETQCFYHQNQALTNFCQECIMPLCPLCIQQHIEQHQSQGNYPIIQSIYFVQDDVKQKLKSLKIDLDQCLQSLQQTKQQLIVTRQEKMIEQITKAKKKVEQVVEQFFSYLIEQVKIQVNNENQQINQDIQKLIDNMTQKQIQADKFEQKIYSTTFIKPLVKLQSTYYIADEKLNCQNIQNYLNDLKNQALQLGIDESKLYTLNIELSKYVQLKSGEQNYKQSKTQQTSQVFFDTNVTQHQPNIPQFYEQSQYRYYPQQHFINTPTPIQNSNIIQSQHYHPNMTYY